MRRAAHSGSAIEVRCEACNVSFPVGTRRCIHCGGPTGAGPPMGLEEILEAQTLPGTSEEPGAFDDEAEEAEMPRGRRMVRHGVALLWVVLAVAASLYRSCAESG